MSGAFYRVDKFAVPDAAREEFLMNVLNTHNILQVQDGFVSHTVLELVTIAQWESADVFERVKAAVFAAHWARNFDPQELFKRLDIRADIANYKPIGA